MTNYELRPATREDVPILYELLLDLAEYEQLKDSVKLTEEMFLEALFAKRPYLEAILAFVEGEPVGFALYYHVFPTFLGRPGMYLEDIYVRPIARGHGIGRSLLSTVARIAVERGCGRVDWSVLNWNEPAIRFYKLLGAEPKTGWTIYQLEGDALQKAAEHGHQVSTDRTS